MKDIMGMMGKVKEMQDRMEAMQAELAETQAEGQSGGGLVRLAITAKGELRNVTIDPSLFAEAQSESGREIIEDLIVAAHADARTKVERIVQEKTAELTEGLPLPPGMKLPF